MFLSHKAMVMDPEVAKDFSRILSDNIKNYENRFGKIEVKKNKKPKIIKDEKLEYTGYIG